MVNDPYTVLGITKGATPDEIKSAYRKMAKKYHPDLHPDDPQAAVKMNEVNEAYDMLTHPEKYQKQRAEEEARQAYSNRYSGYGGSGYSGNSYRSSQSGSQRNQGGYQGAGGWYSDFGGFGFEDFFGFGNNYRETGNASINPTVESTDSPEVRNAINLINTGRYQEAIRILTQIQHNYRNGRWYYLYSIALYGNNDVSQACDYMQKAVQMDPNNTTYHTLLQKFRQEGQTYYRQNTVVFNPFRTIGKVILFFIIMRLLFYFMQILLYSGGAFLPPTM